MKKDTFSIALKVRAKHGIIYNYMVEHDLIFDDLQKKTKISKATLLKMVHFKWIPTDSASARKVVKKLTRFFKCPIEALFPKEVVDMIKADSEIAKILQSDQVITKEVDLVYLNFEEMLKLDLPPYNQEIEEEVFRKELAADVEKVLSSLTSKEEKVVKMFYGIGHDGEYKLDEIGKHFGLTDGRIRQILVKASRKLSHPSRMKILKQYALPHLREKDRKEKKEKDKS